MPLQLTQLDTTYPPTWDGTPHPDVAVLVDALTALRYMEGQDKVNYKTWQRSEGDLFKRDIVSFKNLKDLTDYIGSRNGLLFNSPAYAVAPSTELVLSVPGVSNFNSHYVVAAGAHIRIGAASANTGVRIVNTNGEAVVNTVTTLTEVEFFATTIEDRGADIADPLRLELFNEGATDVVLAGWVALLPKTY